MRVLYFITVFVLFGQTDLYFLKLDQNERSKLAPYDYQQIGKSPFYIIKADKIPRGLSVLGKNRRYKLDSWHLEKIRAFGAQSISSGSTNIPIAIIDSGVDLNNPLNNERYWLNQSEDINNNGVLDSLDLNGIDDDGNGYIDDVIGYDFVDTFNEHPVKDFKTIDPFPQDDFSISGHGSLISSLIHSIVPNSPQMILKAADANGFLEEDDIAKALIYAEENGAKVINLSFGDIVESLFLKQIIQYISDKNVIIVSSSGNNGKASLNYPAAFPEVISVGNTNRFDERTASSNYSKFLDLVAPGTELVLNGLNDQNFTVNGTSFSAPQVSAAVAMILDVFEIEKTDEIRQQIIRFTDDVMFEGKDDETGHGRLNLEKILNQNSYTNINIYLSSKHHFNRDTIPVLLTANGGNIESIDVRIYNENETIYQGQFENRYFHKDSITTINCLELTEGRYEIEVKVSNLKNIDTYYYHEFYVDRTAPEFNLERIGPFLNKEEFDYYIEFNSNEEVQLSLIDDSNNDVLLSSQYLTRDFLKIENHLVKTDTVYLRIKDRANNYTEKKIHYSQNIESYYSKPFSFDKSVLLNFQTLVSNIETDINQNGLKEIYVSKRLSNGLLDTLFILEENGATYQLIKKIAFQSFLRDYRLHNNQHYFSSSYAFKSQIFELDQSFNMINLVEKDDIGLVDKFINFNSELLLSSRNFNSYELYDLGLNKRAESLNNFGNPPGFLGIPNIQLSTNHISYADNNSNILLFQADLSQNFSLKSSYNSGVHNLLLDEERIMHMGEQLNLSGDNAYKKRRRFINLFDLGTRIKTDSLMIQDYNGSSSDSFLKKILINNEKYYLANVSGHLYLLDSLVSPASYLGESSFFSAYVSSDRFVFSDYSKTYQLDFTSTVDLKINYVRHQLVNDTNYQCQLFSQNIVDTVFIYQSVNDSNLELINKVATTSFSIDVEKGKSYQFQYRVKSEGILSDLYVSEKFDLKEELSLFDFSVTNNKYIELIFNKEVLLKNQNHFFYQNEFLSTFYKKKKNIVQLSIDELKSDRTLMLQNISSLSGQVIEDTTIVLTFTPITSSPKLKDYRFESKKKLIISFTDNLPNETTLELENVDNQVGLFTRNNNNLTVHFQRPLYHGKSYTLRIASNTFNERFHFVFNNQVNELIVYPNPVYFDKHKFISISNLESNSRVRLFTITMEKIIDLKITEKSDVFNIDLKKELGYIPASGLYFYYVESGKQVKKGRLTLINR